MAVALTGATFSLHKIAGENMRYQSSQYAHRSLFHTTRFSVIALAGSIAFAGSIGCASDKGRDAVAFDGPPSEAELAFPAVAGEFESAQILVDGRPTQLEYQRIQNERVLEGDILIDDGLMVDTSRPADRVESPLAATTAQRFWPNATVAYVIDSRLPSPNRVTDAIAHWQANTALKFVKRTTEKAYVVFKTGSGCSSNIGRTGSAQTVYLASGCSTGNAIHEIGHAVGLWHEQSRSDRDQNAVVLWNNIQSGMEGNFKTYKERGSAGQDIGAYDFASIMHYGAYAFSSNGKPTITKKDGSTFNANRTKLSTSDLQGIAKMYPPKSN